MDPGRRSAISWVLIVSIILLAVLATLAFVPLFKCPMCDPNIRLTTKKGNEIQGFRPVGNPRPCTFCGDRRKVSLLARWQKREEFLRIDISLPLFP